MSRSDRSYRSYRNYNSYNNRRGRSKGPMVGLIVLIVLAVCMVGLLAITIMKKKDALNPNPTPTPAGIAGADTTPTATTPAPTDTPTPTVHVYTNMVTFSEEGATYTEEVSVSLSFDSTEQGTIYYTLDGTEPTDASTLYQGPITLALPTDSEMSIYQINAVAKKADGSLSESTGHTYFLGSQVNERFSTLVISIYGDEKELTAGPDGILYGDNTYNKGREYERKVYIQAFDSDGVIFSQFGGVRAYGGKSRGLTIPSLKIYARKSYSSENGSFKISVMQTPRVDNPEKIVKKYDKLVLRNGGDDFQCSMIKDELAHQIAKNAGFTDYENTVPVVVYLNGSYYGLMWLHETYCDEYFKNKYGSKAEGEFIIVEGPETWKSTSLADNETELASVNEYNKLYKKYAYSDLTDDATYAELCKLVDVENYLRYYAFQLYCGNFDWPNRNYKCYRYYAAEGESYGEGVFDGRWRFLLHDMDNGLGMFTTSSNVRYKYNDWEDVTSSTYKNKKNERYSPLFANLMKRADCKQYFVAYTNELMNGAFSYTSVMDTMDKMYALRDKELFDYYYPYLTKLKKAGDTSIWTSEKYYTVYYEQIQNFVLNRPDYATKYINELFK